jgi:hypothetical protein
MRVIVKAGAVLMPLIIALGACSGPRPVSSGSSSMKPAHLYVIDDVSASPATMTDPVVAQAVQRRLTEAARQMQLGDTIVVYEAGSRLADREVGHPPIVTDYSLRIPAATALLRGQMQEIAARFKKDGGDGATNLVLPLQLIRPDCSPRSTVVLVTDGLEESDAVSAGRALSDGRPVRLPPPPDKYLAGCHVQFLGFGLTTASSGKAELLPDRQLVALREGWTAYLTNAGVRAEDIEFASVL